jgi:hypothetical protein
VDGRIDELASEKSEKRMDRIEGTEKPERVSPLWK